MASFENPGHREERVLTEKFLTIADKSIEETIKAFFECASGFHGDTGLQHYLYHRIFTNSNSAINWFPSGSSSIGTLLFQSEVYTEMSYKGKKAKKSTPGRFDLAFVLPPANNDFIIPERLKAVIAFDVGRNKRIKAMGDFRALHDLENPKPGDAAKIIRDLRFGRLQVGYILEFFDWKGPSNYQAAQKIAQELSLYCDEIGQTKCRIAVAAIDREGQPRIWLYPSKWQSDFNPKYKQLHGEEPNAPQSRRSYQKGTGRLVYVPEIYRNTFVHFSWQDESCALRDFSKSPNVKPRPERGYATSFVEPQIQNEEVMTERRNVKDIAFWHKRTIEANEKYLAR